MTASDMKYTPRAHQFDAEITLTDIWNFLCNAKWFAVGGVILGCLLAFIYIVITPPVYMSKVTIEVLPSTKNPLLDNFISSDDLIDRLGFDQSILEISKSMKISPDNPQLAVINEALKSAVPSKGGSFLNLSVKSDTPKNAQELAQELSKAIVILVNKINAPKLAYLQKSLAANKSSLVVNSSGIQRVEIQNRIIELEIAIDSATELGPAIVNGPSYLPKPISPNKKSAMLLAAFLGAFFGCLSFYLKGLFLR